MEATVIARGRASRAEKCDSVEDCGAEDIVVVTEVQIGVPQ
jgi:hypothetical protein